MICVHNVGMLHESMSQACVVNGGSSHKCAVMIVVNVWPRGEPLGHANDAKG